MKAARQLKGKKIEVPAKQNASMDYNGVKKFMKRTSGLCQKVTGQSRHFLVKKDMLSLPSSTAQELSQQLPDKATHFTETTRNVTVLKLDSGNVLNPAAKIKLQLFPIDEGTRIGLEKDGHNPYLELSLRARKRISSVLKHLNNKWGSSSIAYGELMLFPYNTRLESPASWQRWTSNDSGCAGDVYAAIGSPAIFCLRYGWVSNFKPKASGVPRPSTALEAVSQHKGMEKGFRANMETICGKKKQAEVATNEEFRPINKSEGTNALITEKMFSDAAVDLVDGEVKMDNGLSLTSTPWADSLSNISIGGLLSEASLQGKFNNCDPKLNCSNSGLQPFQLISDSFDASAAAQTNPHPQGVRPSSRTLHSSILDAEETCHAFPFSKFSSSGKDALALCGSAYSGAGNQDASSRSLKFHNLAEVKSQSGLAGDNASQESKPDMLSCSRVYNDESSLGLTGIKWSDSLGPFDLGLSSSQRIIRGDNASFSRFVS